MQRYSFKIIAVLMVVVLGLSIQSNSTMVAAQTGGELVVPERVEIENTLNAGTGNDIYFSSTPDNAILDHQFESTQDGFNLYQSQGMDRSFIGNINAYSQFQAAGSGSMYHASNISSNILQLNYKTAYYDLTGGLTNVSSVSNTVLLADEQTGVQFSADADDPLIIDFKFKSQTDTVSLNMSLITPSGEIYLFGDSSSLVFNTFVHEYVPFVPSETGDYILYLEPLNDDLIMETFSVFSDVPIETINSGFTDSFIGTETWTQFYKLDLSNSTNAGDGPQILNIKAQQFIDEALEAYQQPAELLGQLKMTYFSSLTSPFGSQLPAEVLLTGNNTIYVAVTALPPNEDNPFIKAEKEELGLDPGFNVEFAFYSELFDLDELVLNEDFRLEAATQPNSNAYTFSTSSTQLIGINQTGGSVAAIIYNANDLTEFYQLSSISNNILGDTDDIVRLPAGDYIVGLFGSADEFRIHSFAVQTLEPGDDTTTFLRYNTPQIYTLPTIDPNNDYFNFTVTEQVNMTFNMDVTLYNSLGEALFTDNFDLSGNTSATPGDLDVFNNFTEFSTTLSSIFSYYNVENGMIRINMVSNIFYGTVNTNNVDTPVTVKIERLNYLDVWSGNNPDGQIVQQAFGSGLDVSLNGSKTSILYVFSFTSNNNPQGYQFYFETVNMTFDIRLFSDYTNLWVDDSSDPLPSSGDPRYYYSLEFGTTEATNFAIVLRLNTGDNGTLSAALNSVVPTILNAPQISSINTLDYEDANTDNPVNAGEDNGSLADFFSNPLVWGGAAGLAVIIGAVVYFLKSRGKTPF